MGFKGNQHIRSKTITDPQCKRSDKRILTTVELLHHVQTVMTYIYIYIYIYIYRVSQEERTKLWEGVPYVKLYRYNPKHLCPKLNGY